MYNKHFKEETRTFKSNCTLYHDFDGEGISEENPRNEDDLAEYKFARKGSIFRLIKLDDEEAKEAGHKLELDNSKMTIYFDDEEEIKQTNWFTETTKEGYRCVLCGKWKIGWGPRKQWGNNPSPLANHGECCNDCNPSVINERLMNLALRKVSNNEF